MKNHDGDDDDNKNNKIYPICTGLLTYPSPDQISFVIGSKPICSLLPMLSMTCPYACTYLLIKSRFGLDFLPFSSFTNENVHWKITLWLQGRIHLQQRKDYSFPGKFEISLTEPESMNLKLLLIKKRKANYVTILHKKMKNKRLFS